MIAPAVVQEVRRLLAKGNLSQRKIAGLTGISRGTVGAIAAGKRPDHESLGRAAKDEFPEPAGPLQRCPGCGGMVYMPCRLCHARALKARSSRPPIPAWLVQLDEPLGLDLREDDRARYEQIRSQKVDASTSKRGCQADQPGEGPRIERGDLCSAFEPEDDEWELNPAAFGELSRADLRDAFEWEDWEDDEPVIDYRSVPAYEEGLLPDSV